MPAKPGLPLRDQRVLAALAGDGQVSFQGLRRLLGLHPQALSRSLKRLRMNGFVVGDATGYRTAQPALAEADETGKSLMPTIPLEQSAVLAAVLLASPDAVRLLESALSGRWLRSLRWLGKARSAGVTILAWLVEPDGLVIRLVLDGRHARVEVAEEARDDPPVHAAVHALLPAVSVALARGIEPVGPRAAMRVPLLMA
ncbi:MAG: Lrp/AsnC family transcriptional regulator [Halobacteriales archaeon]|nr:Lrp/AsnC family transcriptional regulator [Halobacteriales archaeon]